ncbi:hypothetical protein JTB14_006274 [Gonioctena quinquepunctata]|nr:hypothetical protein JTB14_006274 [Gonioctena quinquepunctata]
MKDAGYNWLKFVHVNGQRTSFVVELLKPRGAFFGGRTNAAKLKVSGKKNQIHRCVVSLYPTVQYSNPYPIGHPLKILKHTEHNPKWFGLVRCVVLPLRSLYHPVLLCVVHV